MNLYHLSQRRNKDYDTYDSCVVAAVSPKDAVKIHPNGREVADCDEWSINTWAHVEHVQCVYIGKAAANMERGVVCASFNAG